MFNAKTSDHGYVFAGYCTCLVFTVGNVNHALFTVSAVLR